MTRQITGVTVGTQETDAVNVAQLKAVGWNVSAGGANSTKVGAASATGDSVELNSTDGNIVVGKTTTSNDVSFSLASTVIHDGIMQARRAPEDGQGASAIALGIVGGPIPRRRWLRPLLMQLPASP
ncbi:hypothetical protein [Rhodopseudomonas sp.]|uniref:hypothetical protein n=1 Tax=Rhodopseudomonas sp. TaxID=1078 RepID=UPI0039E2CF6D